MKTFIVALALRGLLNFGWFRTAGTWLIRITGRARRFSKIAGRRIGHEAIEWALGAQGIASAPEAFLGLLKGKNFGKQLVKLV